MLKIEGLTKVYGAFKAVDDVNIHVHKGEIYGFLGPNGAGKTTTIRMIIGLIKATSGKITIGGHDIQKNPTEAKRLVGFVPDRPFIYEKLTGAEFLEFVADLYEVDPDLKKRRVPELLDFFELSDWGGELIEGFSHGMKQRLVMASALIHTPPVIIVDEPMVGLDPKGARLLKETFKRLAADGTTIFMSTHSLEVAEELCTRIAIIQNGKILTEGTMDDLRKLAKTDDGRLESIFLTLTGDEDMEPA